MWKKRYLKLVRRALRTLRHRRLRRIAWWRKISVPLFHRALWIPCRDTVAGGFAVGLFFSMMLMPFQMLAAGLIAMRFRVNVPFAMAACWLTNPLTQLPIVITQAKLGRWLHHTVGLPVPTFVGRIHLNLPGAGSLDAATYILGMMISGIALALLAFPIVHLFSALMPQHLPIVSAKIRKAAADRTRLVFERRAQRRRERHAAAEHEKLRHTGEISGAATPTPTAAAAAGNSPAKNSPADENLADLPGDRPHSGISASENPR